MIGPDVESQQASNQTYAEATSEVSSAAINVMAPAEKGWILASVILMLGSIALIEITSYLESTQRADRTSIYLSEIEKNRAAELRRTQETIRILSNSMSRQADRTGRTVAEKQQQDSIDAAREGTKNERN